MVNFFYDWTDDKRLSSDPEGCTVVLCENCADLYADDIELAQDGDGNDTCELCGGLE